MNGALLRLIRRGRLRSEDGANAVEFALVLIPLMLILFGIFSGGIIFNRQLTLTHSAREAARFGATLAPEADIDDWFDAVVARAEESAAGDLHPSISDRYICVALVDLGSTESRRVGSPPQGFSGSGLCFDDEQGTQERVQVLVVRPSSFNAIFYNRSGIPVRGEAVARYEHAEAP